MIGVNIGSMNTSVAYSECSSGKFTTEILLSETSSRTLP